ncbi:MAG: aldo/keto reductase [Pseudoramibacter sp.]
MAWYPLGHGDKSLIQEPVFTELGKKYGKSNAQIILRWHIQSGNVVIPGSKNPDHIRDNFDIFDFELTDDDMAAIAKVDKGVRYYNATPEIVASYANMELGPDL